MHDAKAWLDEQEGYFRSPVVSRGQVLEYRTLGAGRSRAPPPQDQGNMYGSGLNLSTAFVPLDMPSRTDITASPGRSPAPSYTGAADSRSGRSTPASSGL